jgi:two-component system phosphate regulon response regulator PhoB
MNAGHKVLLVEDEADLSELLRYNLEREGYECRCAADGVSAVAELKREPPDLMILDRLLPGLSGDEVIRKVRREPRTAHMPVIMLTARSAESDALVGFALGADDYIAKPFSMKLLLARIRALLRRGTSAASTTDILRAGPVVLDRSLRELRLDGTPVMLTQAEFCILRELMAGNGRVLDRQQLMQKALGTSVTVAGRTVDVHIASLRKKLGSAADMIRTIRGVGYALRTEFNAE